MSGNRRKKQCPYNEGVFCSDEGCEYCGWYPGGRRKGKRELPPTKKIPMRKEEGMARKKQKNNTSGNTGVYWNKNRKKWTAEIRREGKRCFLGCFDRLEDAVKARKEAEERILQ